jgi:hypothetical protein
MLSQDGRGPTIRARKSNSSSTGAYFFGALDLTKTPSRIATLRIRSGVRFIAFAICSSVLGARASAITRRSSLNDQPFRISRHSRPLRTKPPSGVYSPDGFATVGPDHGELSGKMISTRKRMRRNQSSKLSFIHAKRVKSGTVPCASNSSLNLSRGWGLCP